MHSIRTRFTFLTVIVIVISVSIATLLSVLFIRNNEHRRSDQILLLLCETGERNLDYYFDSVQNSVAKVSRFVENDLSSLDDAEFSQHMERAEEFFEEMAYKTNGVLTFYYRVDPEVSDTVKGFWYTNLDGQGFIPHEVTDITLYDTEDTSALVWFTVPKYEGRAIWLPPYITDNLDVRVISYNVPIYFRGQFVGVVGIELDYSMMAEQVDSIRLYQDGYAFLNDDQGNLFYHPRIDVASLTPETTPKTPEGVLRDSTFLEYTFEGVEREAAWLPLTNGMRLNVTVPIMETEGNWKTLLRDIVIVSVLVIVAMIAFTMLYSRRITRPLEELTRAAEQVNRGKYDIELDYAEDDEVGRLTNTFLHMASHMKQHVSDLNKRANVDALTSVRNKGAFVTYVQELQDKLDSGEATTDFAIGVFDTDDLKAVNDQYGHDKGDIYIKAACRLICSVFQHSPVFRIGGDEFAVVLRGEDFENREALQEKFIAERDRIAGESTEPWTQARVTMGVADFDPALDKTVNDVMRRADKLMYEKKRERKINRSA